MHITLNAYWFPFVVASKEPIKSIEIKFIRVRAFSKVVSHTLVSVDLLFDIADSVWQIYVLIPSGPSSNIASLVIDTI